MFWMKWDFLIGGVIDIFLIVEVIVVVWDWVFVIKGLLKFFVEFCEEWIFNWKEGDGLVGLSFVKLFVVEDLWGMSWEILEKVFIELCKIVFLVWLYLESLVWEVVIFWDCEFMELWVMMMLMFLDWFFWVVEL